jgi:hypothetical protein
MRPRSWRGAAFCVLLLGLPSVGAPAARTRPFLHGADLSALPEIEAAGGVFGDADSSGDAVAILRAHGMDAVRLRLWHAPARGACGLAATVAMARRVKAHGLPLLLDLHYSDTWADPGHQAKPAAWGPVHGRARRSASSCTSRRADAPVRPSDSSIGCGLGTCGSTPSACRTTRGGTDRSIRSRPR